MKHTIQTRRLRNVVAFITLSAAVSLSGTVAASAPPPTPTEPPPSEELPPAPSEELPPIHLTVQPDGWILYGSSAADMGISGTTERLTGTKNADGSCKFNNKRQHGPIATGVEMTEEVAFNPLTCERDIRTSMLTDAQYAEIEQAATPPERPDMAITDLNGDPNSPDANDETTSGTNPAAGLITGQAALRQYTSWIKVVYSDPLYITITSQKIGLRWNRAQWLRWKQEPYSFQGCLVGTNICIDQTHRTYSKAGARRQGNLSVMNAVSDFYNDTFALWVLAGLGPHGWASCGFFWSPRADFHHDVTMYGHSNGLSTETWGDRASGACTNLVHHDEFRGEFWDGL